MTTLILVRHGETDWNAQHRWQGHSDTTLNEVGREQARRLADELEPVDALYSCDLARAKETAEINAERRRITEELATTQAKKSYAVINTKFGDMYADHWGGNKEKALEILDGLPAERRDLPDHDATTKPRVAAMTAAYNGSQTSPTLTIARETSSDRRRPSRCRSIN